MRSDVKKLIIRIFAIILLIGSFVVIFNRVVDSYNIFAKDYSFRYLWLNQHYVKMRYLLNHKSTYDTFLFGNSRVSRIDVSKIPNAVVYNMTYIPASADGYLLDLQFLLRHGITVKNVIIGLDELIYQADFKTEKNKALTRSYPETWIEKIKFFSFYLFMQPTLETLNTYRSNKVEGKHMNYDIYGSGGLDFPYRDNLIESDVKAHVNGEQFQKPYKPESRQYLLESSLDYIDQIIKLCEAQNIRLSFFINPIHRTTYEHLEREEFEQFRDRLSRLTGYWDFSGINSVTTNNYLYYETSHYRASVGDMMISRMYDLPLIDVPADFGRYISRK